jgi:WD40-like Beta Propeller Repeat
MAQARVDHDATRLGLHRLKHLDIQQLTSDALDNEYPNWSPDGGRIPFNSNRDDPLEENYEICTKRAGGDHVTRLTFNPAAMASRPGRPMGAGWRLPAAATDPPTSTRCAPTVKIRSTGPNDAFEFALDWQPIDGRDDDHNWALCAQAGMCTPPQVASP